MDDVPARRWLVLGADGRHVTLGRHRVPDEADLVRVTEGLEAQGIAGWLVRMDGDYYGTTPPVLEPIRRLVGDKPDWEVAKREFEVRRLNSLP